jgi:hypothetical protein
VPLQREFGRVALPWVRSNGPTDPLQDTIFLKKRPKTIVIRIIVLDDNIQIYSYGLLCDHVLSMRTVWTCSTSLSSFQRSNWSPTYILHLFHLEDTSLLLIFLSESVKVRFLARVDTFSFVQEPHVVFVISI